MLYTCGETHEEQKVSRLIPRRRFKWKAWRKGTLHDGRNFRFGQFWIVQIGRYPLSMGPHTQNNTRAGQPLNGTRYVVWGYFATREEAVTLASDKVRHKPWFYGTEEPDMSHVGSAHE
ncbi:hypothetical protein LCGC14_1442740 [marine sediment metagenome]|uniref:Uncharacterized protein n=1 Tax=marine sediment metagenome TaxID=412755 RepID=A0A0F9JK42_9ZZZZ